MEWPPADRRQSDFRKRRRVGVAQHWPVRYRLVIRRWAAVPSFIFYLLNGTLENWSWAEETSFKRIDKPSSATVADVAIGSRRTADSPGLRRWVCRFGSKDSDIDGRWHRDAGDDHEVEGDRRSRGERLRRRRARRPVSGR